jgi:hypothetical protein
VVVPADGEVEPLEGIGHVVDVTVLGGAGERRVQVDHLVDQGDVYDSLDPF